MADFSRLPGPNADLWDWQLLAACRGVDSSLFFHPEGERGAARSAREASAKEVCMRCPVRSECAAHALTVREPYGVWGGLTEDEREELMGRPQQAPDDHGHRTGRPALAPRPSAGATDLRQRQPQPRCRQKPGARPRRERAGPARGRTAPAYSCRPCCFSRSMWPGRTVPTTPTSKPPASTSARSPGPWRRRPRPPGHRREWSRRGRGLRPRHHGGDDQAVYAYAREDLDRWERELGRELPAVSSARTSPPAVWT